MKTTSSYEKFQNLVKAFIGLIVVIGMFLTSEEVRPFNINGYHVDSVKISYKNNYYYIVDEKEVFEFAEMIRNTEFKRRNFLKRKETPNDYSISFYEGKKFVSYFMYDRVSRKLKPYGDVTNNSFYQKLEQFIDRSLKQ